LRIGASGVSLKSAGLFDGVALGLAFGFGAMEFGESVVGRVDAEEEADESIVGVVDGAVFGFGEAGCFEEVFVDTGTDGAVHGVEPWGEEVGVGWRESDVVGGVVRKR